MASKLENMEKVLAQLKQRLDEVMPKLSAAQSLFESFSASSRDSFFGENILNNITKYEIEIAQLTKRMGELSAASKGVKLPGTPGFNPANLDDRQPKQTKRIVSDINEVFANENPNKQKMTAELGKEVLLLQKLRGEAISLFDTKVRLVDGNTRLTTSVIGETKVLGELAITYDSLGNRIDSAGKKQKDFTAEQKIAAEALYKNANEMARAVDPRYQLKTITKNTAGANSNVTRLDYQFTDEETGAVNKASYTLDRYGQVLLNTTKSTRTFAQGVARDTIEMLKWSIAMSIIYVPMRKLGELMQLMIKNEALLADVAVTLGNAHVPVAEIFNTVAEAADAAGESVDGVIGGFTLAYRATGNLGSSQERMIIATKLMNDALILSKISTLDQGQAIDTLAAALRQTGMGLDQGTLLLDKWVKTTKVANVDLATLATGFAVLGDTAETAGLSIDQLNGLMAAIAETGISSAAESANQARAIVSGFQSDKAAKELMRYGIAVNDVTTNQLRPFMDVMQEIYDLKQAGVLSAPDMAKITLALGGGTRRQAVYSAFLENFDRVKQVAEESALASGDAASAMAKELDTVETAITRLGNSFQSLAQTFGESGGLLDLFKQLVNLGNFAVGIFDSLTGSIGKVAPVLYSLGIASFLFSKQPELKQNAIMGGIARGIAGPINLLTGGAYGRGTVRPGYAEDTRFPNERNPAYINLGTGKTVANSEALQQSKGQNVANWLLGGSLGANATLGALSVLPGLVGTLTDKDKTSKEKYLEAGWGIGGAVVGFILAQGNPIGALIGQAAGTAMANTAISLMKYNPEKIAPFQWIPPSPSTPEDAANKNVEDAQNAILKGRMGIVDSIEAWLINSVLQAENKAEGGFGLDTFTKENLAYQKATPEQIEILKASRAVANKDVTIGSLATRQADILSSTKTQEELSNLQAGQKTAYIGQLASGELTPTKYTNAVQALDTFKQDATGFYVTIGEKLIEVNDKFNTQNDVYSAYLDLLVYGSEEQIGNVTGWSSRIRSLQGELDRLGLLPETNKTITSSLINPETTKAYEGNRNELIKIFEDLLSNAKTEGVNVFVPTYERTQYEKAVNNILPSGQAVANIDEARMIVERARQYDNAKLEASGISDDVAEIWKSELEDWFFILTDGTKTTFEKMSQFGEKVSQEAASAAIKDLKDEGKLQDTTKLGFQAYDITRAQYNQAMQGYAPLLKKLEAKGYEESTTELIGIFKDGIDKDERDQGIANYLLQQLVDLNQKQLDGMYNIPDGANFWIPYNDQLIGMLQAGFAPDAAVFDDTGIVNGGHEDARTVANAIYGAFGKPETPLRPLGWDKRNLSRSDTASSSIPGWPLTEEDVLNAYKTLGIDIDTGKKTRSNTETDRWRAGFLEREYETAPTYNKSDILGYSGKGRGMASMAQLSGIIGSQKMDTSPQSKIDLKMDTKIQLVVDGRTLANVVKSYIMGDLLRAQAGFGTKTRNNVITIV